MKAVKKPICSVLRRGFSSNRVLHWLLIRWNFTVFSASLYSKAKVFRMKSPIITVFLCLDLPNNT